MTQAVNLLGDRLLISTESTAPFSTDWTRTPGNALAVALPKTVLEVQKVMALCHEHRIAVVPSGGRTGLAGGAVPGHDELVLSLQHLNQIGPLDQTHQTLTVGAGAINAAVQEHCDPFDLMWPIDLGSRGSCTIGGNLATNAGGLHVVRYGMTRNWVSGIQAVTMDGQIIEAGHGLKKNNTGYSLLHLLIGSEGTLAIITQATLRLAPKPKNLQLLFVCLDSLDRIEDLLEHAHHLPGVIHSFEFFSNSAYQEVKRCLGKTHGMDSQGAYYVLVEWENQTSANPKLDAWLETLLAIPGIGDAILSESTSQAKRFWELREGITEALATYPRVVKFDLSVPPQRLRFVLSEIETFWPEKQRRSRVFTFGHYADASPHVNLVQPHGMKDPAFERELAEFEDLLFELLDQEKGCPSSEHGIGLVKKKWMQQSKPAHELEILKGIKTAWDPLHLLNPGKIF